MIRLGILMLLAVVAAAAECTPVTGPRILGRDLKKAGAGLALDDEAVVGFAPEPGLERRLSPLEAKRFGITDGGICFRRLAQPLSAGRMEAALAASLAGREVHMELLDFSKVPVPEGTLEFPLSGLSRPPRWGADAAVLWRGRLSFDGRRSVPVWARVRLSETGQWVESAVVLRQGVPVEAAQIAVKTAARFPGDHAGDAEPAVFTGKVPKRTIPAGQELRAEMFAEPFLVERGETVAVEVASGVVSLRFEARAETPGRTNDSILVFDATTGKRMKARVAARGKVIIDANSRVPVAAVRAGAGGDSERSR